MAEYNTEQKKLLLGFLEENHDSAYTIEEIAQELKSRGANVGKSTVYRLIAKLVDDGILQRISDGKTRKVENPKRKKRRHVLFVSAEKTRLSEKITGNEKFTNSELRRTLAAFRDEVQPDQEG